MLGSRGLLPRLALITGSIMMLVACGGGADRGAAESGDGIQAVDLRLDWLFQGPNAGFMTAASKGIYEDAGLDVSIKPGEGSATTAQLVANRSATIGFADGYVVAQNRAKGAEVKMVAAIYRQNPNGVVVLDDSPIQEPEDLEGSSVGIPAGASQAQQWPAYVQGCGIDGDSVRVVNIEPASAPQVLLQGQVDAIAGYVQGFAPAIEARGGTDTRALWYSDCGVTAVSNGIIVHDETLKEDPGMIRRFVEASIKGFLYARENPEEAVDIVQEFSPEVDPEVTLREMELSWETWVTPGTEGQSLGYMSEEEWRAMLDVIEQYGGVEEAPSLDELFTNQFVPEGDDYVPPQG